MTLTREEIEQGAVPGLHSIKGATVVIQGFGNAGMFGAKNLLLHGQGTAKPALRLGQVVAQIGNRRQRVERPDQPPAGTPPRAPRPSLMRGGSS